MFTQSKQGPFKKYRVLGYTNLKKGSDNNDCNRYFFQKVDIKTTGGTGQLLEQIIWGIQNYTLHPVVKRRGNINTTPIHHEIVSNLLSSWEAHVIWQQT